ncbi:MAG TPA: hypothetical protein VGU24_00260 [Microvirga sp.]|jgi:hypothetical protein|nr:hypothetical protein [Microvirga sp.]
MPRLPRPLIRSAALATLAAGLVVAHTTFAAAASRQPAKAPQTVHAAHHTTERLLTASLQLGENCYVEAQEDLTVEGRSATRLVTECD